jgi:hypothetical protein
MPAIRRFLDLSTTHLNPEDVEALNTAARKMAAPSCVKTECGWFVWAPDEIEAFGPTDIPSNLRHILSYARAHGCEFVLFDSGAEVDDGLLTWHQTEGAHA